MNIFLTCYGVDTRHKESINSYDEIIDVLRNKRVVIIPNARLIGENRDSSYNVYKELKKNNIYCEIVDIDSNDLNLSYFDAIYFTGGEPKYLMNSVYNNNLFDLINNFIINGGITIGQSAGAMIFNKQYIDTSTHKIRIIDNGFDFCDRVIVPHFDCLSEDILNFLPDNILKINDSDGVIKLD